MKKRIFSQKQKISCKFRSQAMIHHLAIFNNCTMRGSSFKQIKLSELLVQSNFQLSVESNPGLNWFCFTVLFDWSRKLAPPSQPIRCKLKPIAPWSLAFSRATGRLHAFTSSCHWLPLIISFTLIGHCDYFGFGFRHSTSSPPFFLRDSTGQQTVRNASARENHPTREKATFFSLPAACRLFSRWVIFTRTRVSLALLSLRKNQWGTSRSLVCSAHFSQIQLQLLFTGKETIVLKSLVTGSCRSPHSE